MKIIRIITVILPAVLLFSSCGTLVKHRYTGGFHLNFENGASSENQNPKIRIKQAQPYAENCTAASSRAADLVRLKTGFPQAEKISYRNPAPVSQKNPSSQQKKIHQPVGKTAVLHAELSKPRPPFVKLTPESEWYFSMQRNKVLNTIIGVISLMIAVISIVGAVYVFNNTPGILLPFFVALGPLAYGALALSFLAMILFTAWWAGFIPLVKKCQDWELPEIDRRFKESLKISILCILIGLVPFAYFILGIIFYLMFLKPTINRRLKALRKKGIQLE